MLSIAQMPHRSNKMKKAMMTQIHQLSFAHSMNALLRKCHGSWTSTYFANFSRSAAMVDAAPLKALPRSSDSMELVGRGVDI